jgi:hypothetical protein
MLWFFQDSKITYFLIKIKRKPGIGPDRSITTIALAIADKNHRCRVQVQYDGQVTMPLANADFINSDPLQVAALRTLEPLTQIPFEDIFCSIPFDFEMGGDNPGWPVQLTLASNQLEWFRSQKIDRT